MDDIVARDERQDSRVLYTPLLKGKFSALKVNLSEDC